MTQDEITAETTTGRPVMPNARSVETLKLAKQWVDSCSGDHQECRLFEGDQEPLLPTRLIDISDYEHGTARLISSDGRRGKWVAISHRWGNKPVFTLCQSNIKTLKRGIAITTLPATFKDAITITKHIGIQYLWIDSLCILQDSPIDWQTEAAKMPEIYQNAYLTIGSAATGDPNGGILVERAWASRSQGIKLPVRAAKVV